MMMPNSPDDPDVVGVAVGDRVEVDVAGVDARVERALGQLHLGRDARRPSSVVPPSSVWIMVPKSPAPWPRCAVANWSAKRWRCDPVWSCVQVAPPSVVP